ncbi:hypothetical protein ACIQU4_17930 [Streptomyces sp. NPDC090741]|uniref:hypothetical protein n=1 Tax=Streptomyces sp. NPDC090741 TaxID=3365967 RepID=UPI0037FB6A48
MGANLAMLDGTDLARAIIKTPTIDDGLRTYEATPLPRSVQAAEGAAEGIGSTVAPDSATTTLGHMTQHH